MEVGGRENSKDGDESCFFRDSKRTLFSGSDGVATMVLWGVPHTGVV